VCVSKKERLKCQCPKMTMSLRRHYKSCSKCHGNERLKRKAFRRLRKTDIEGADVTCWGRLFQVRAAATGKARSPTVDSRVRRTFNVNDDEERRATPSKLRRNQGQTVAFCMTVTGYIRKTVTVTITG